MHHLPPCPTVSQLLLMSVCRRAVLPVLCQRLHPWFRTNWQVILAPVQRQTYSVVYASKAGNLALQFSDTPVIMLACNHTRKWKQTQTRVVLNLSESCSDIFYLYLCYNCKQELRWCSVCTAFSAQRPFSYEPRFSASGWYSCACVLFWFYRAVVG